MIWLFGLLFVVYLCGVGIFIGSSLGDYSNF